MAVWLFAELRLAAGAAPGATRDALMARFGGTFEGTGSAQRKSDALGGRIWGMWHGGPGIGFRNDVVLACTSWPDDAAAGAATETMASLAGVVAVEATPLHPTARPLDTAPIGGNGIWVFRDFEIERTRIDRFLALSTEAWASFEDAFDVHIDGLFRAPDPDPETARLLLITRYADLATWERSRSAEADPIAWSAFEERRRITRWTRARSAVRIAP